MTTAQREGRVSYTEISSSTSGPVDSVAPNGSSRSVDYYTKVIGRQGWTDDPRNGVYAGRSYRITETYISPDARRRGQLLHSSSQPW